MKRVISSIYGLFLLFAPVQPINAQVLDGETAQEASFPSSGGLSFDETDKNEALFNEMFGDHPEIREDVENTENFENTAQKAAEKIKANRGDGSVRTSRRHSQAFKRRYAYRCQQRQL